MTEAELVEQLARLPDEKRRDVTKAAAVARQRRVQIAIQQVRKTLLAGFRDRKAARAIDDAVCGRRTGSDPALRSAIAQLAGCPWLSRRSARRGQNSPTL
jgi:hypothetical protein